MYDIIFILILLVIFVFIDIYINKKIDNQDKKIEDQKKQLEAQNLEIKKQMNEIEKQNKAIEKQNKAIAKQNKEIEKQNKVIAKQNKAIAKLNKAIAKQKKKILKKENKILKQGISIEKLDDIITETNEKFSKEISSLNNKLDNLKIIFLLEENLNTQINIYFRKKIVMLENQYQRIINSYKLLYFRNIPNLILEFLFKKYNQYFSKTESIFCDKSKPKDKQRNFSIIGVSNRYNHILSINKNIVNLIIDYLMYMKDIASSIIPISKVDYNVQIEILSEYIGKEIENFDGKYYISSSDLINLLFDDQENENDIDDEEGILPIKLRNKNFSEDISTIGISENSEENKNGKSINKKLELKIINQKLVTH